MQENIESFVGYFGQHHCYEFTAGAVNLTPEEFGRRWNSCVTNFLRKVMPDRIAVLEPHKTGHAHTHNLVSLPFTSPNFDHDALAASREAYNRKDFAESKRQWAKVKASMSPELRAMWELLQTELVKYGLGKQISLTPVRESARAIASYFGKYLAKGIASRPDSWKRVRLVRYSGTNGQEAPAWKCASPQRSSNCMAEQNRRDKARAVAREFGADTPEQVKAILGPHWYFFGKNLIHRVQLLVYRSLLHADHDGVPVQVPAGTRQFFVPAPDAIPEVGYHGDPTLERLKVVFPDEAYMPWSPPPDARRPDACTAREVAIALLDQASPYRPAAAAHAALLRTFPGPTLTCT